MAKNEPNRKEFKKEGQTEETTRKVKITEKQAQKESAKSAIKNLAPRCRDFSAHLKCFEPGREGALTMFKLCMIKEQR